MLKCPECKRVNDFPRMNTIIKKYEYNICANCFIQRHKLVQLKPLDLAEEMGK